MRSLSEPSEHVFTVALYVLRHPWDIFIRQWNWKSALLSALFRGAAFALPMSRLTGDGTWRVLCIEVAFRIAVGGFWGSLLQAFRNAQPAWLAGFCAAVAIPLAAHGLEFAALRMGHATHVTTAMVVSVAISAGSLILNYGLMRRGLLITGSGGDSLGADFRRIPAALTSMIRGTAGSAS
jgi:hypothetical protein